MAKIDEVATDIKHILKKQESHDIKFDGIMERLSNGASSISTNTEGIKNNSRWLSRQWKVLATVFTLIVGAIGFLANLHF